VFGATRSEILRLHASETGMAAGLAALVAAIIGLGAAYPVVVFVFEAEWSFPWQGAGLIAAAAAVLAAAGGAAASLSALSRSAADVLRTP
jgi:putative ABC transport system permease protein